MAFNFHRAAEGIVLANSHRGYSSCAPENTFPAFEAARLAFGEEAELFSERTEEGWRIYGSARLTVSSHMQ